MKRGKKMALLIGLLVVLMIGYAALGSIEPDAPVTQTQGSYPLWTEGLTVASLGWTREGETYAFSMGEHVWMKDGDEAFPVNQTVIQNMADRMETLTAVSELTDVKNVSDYGLDEPVFTVKVKDQSGVETVYAMGDQTPFEDGYYLSVTGSENVYVINASLEEIFNKTLTQMALMEDLPAVTEVTRMTVGDTLDAVYSSENGAWTDAATGEALDGSAVDELAGYAGNLIWDELIAADASDEELSAWALDDTQAVRLTLYHGDTAERTLLLGAANDEGERYARLPESRMVYTLSGEEMDALLQASMDTLWMKTLSGMTVEEISAIACAWDGGEITLTAQDSESATMQGVVEQFALMEGTQRVELGDLQEVVLTAEVTDTAGKARTYTFHAYSIDSYLLPMTDTHGMLVPAEDVDKLIRMLRQKP